MSDEYSELVRRLRVVDPPRRGSDKVMLHAADVIEALVAEIEALRGSPIAPKGPQ